MNRLYVYTGICTISLFLWWTSISATVQKALNDDQYTHLLIILPISLLFAFLDRKRLIATPSAKSLILAGMLLVASLGIFLAAYTIASVDLWLTFSMLGLVLWWIGSFVLVFGKNTSRAFLFPLSFLFWLVPWPQSLLDTSIRLLQQYSAAGAEYLFDLVGVPVLRQGMILSIPTLTIEVAKECSSIRSSLILLVSSMVLAQLFLHSKWRKAIVMIVAVPLSVLKNAVRIFTLSMLGVHVNRGFLTGRLHHEGGGLFYALALGLLFLLVHLLQRGKTVKTQQVVLQPALK